MSAKRLHDAVRTLRDALLKATRFVVKEFGMASTDALPYEAQWLLLLRLILEKASLKSVAPQLRYWFISTSFFEALKGRPDHALVRMIDEIVLALSSGSSIEMPSKDLRSSELITKRFLRGKATSVAYVQFLIRNGLFDQLPLVNVPYEQFVPIVDRVALSEAFGRNITFARTIANVVYVPSELMRNWEGGISSLNRLLELHPELIGPQFLSDRFLRHIKRGEIRQALQIRASSIRNSVVHLEYDET
jgi:hypothetical protein